MSNKQASLARLAKDLKEFYTSYKRLLAKVDDDERADILQKQNNKLKAILDKYGGADDCNGDNGSIPDDFAAYMQDLLAKAKDWPSSSFAFLLRAAAAAHVDVMEQEISRLKEEDGDSSEADTDVPEEMDHAKDFDGEDGEAEDGGDREVEEGGDGEADDGGDAGEEDNDYGEEEPKPSTSRLKRTRSKVQMMKKDLKYARQVNAIYNHRRYGLRSQLKRTTSRVYRCTRCQFWAYQQRALKEHQVKMKH